MTKDEALKLAKQLISNLRTHSWTTTDEQHVLKAIDEALAQPEQEHCNHRIADIRNEVVKSGYMCMDCGALFGAYTTPPQRKPLTDEQICPWFQENTALTNEAAMRITRAIEAAHGIKE